jgi:hypothetical protein
MIEFLNFTFQSFWHFLGIFILLLLICDAVVTVVAKICKTIIACATGVVIDENEDDEEKE